MATGIAQQDHTADAGFATEQPWLGDGPLVFPGVASTVVGPGVGQSSTDVSEFHGDVLQRPQPVVRPEGNRAAGFLIAKRTIDVAGALGLLVLLGPIMAVVFLVLLVTTRGRPIFCQRRIGYLGRPFPMLKFRTMVPDADHQQHEVANEQDGPVFKNRRDPRITRIGAWLRRTSLDETPQLFNVLLGQMSLVGPRPPVHDEVVQYEPWQRRRLAVKPGLTCLWQVSGRCEIGFDDWVRMDLWYLERQSLRTDLMLLVRTPLSVLSGRGAY